MAYCALSFFVKEFWPGIRRRLRKQGNYALGALEQADIEAGFGQLLSQLPDYLGSGFPKKTAPRRASGVSLLVSLWFQAVQRP